MKKIFTFIVSAIMAATMIGTVHVSAEEVEAKTKIQVFGIRDLVYYLKEFNDSEIMYSDEYMTIWYNTESIPEADFNDMVEIYHINKWSDLQEELNRIGWDWDMYREYCIHEHLISMYNNGTDSLVLTV